MNEGQERPGAHLADWAALAVQQLRCDGKLDGRALLRIDNRSESATAPFQFDAVNGTLHRQGCRAIPIGARSALYGLWQIGPEERRRACPRCRPVPDEHKTTEPTDRTDLLFGLISVVDQFAGVLKERGRDFQQTSEGQKLNSQLGSFYRALGQREKETLDTVLSSLDQLVRRIREVDSGLTRTRDEGRRDD